MAELTVTVTANNSANFSVKADKKCSIAYIHDSDKVLKTQQISTTSVDVTAPVVIFFSVLANISDLNNAITNKDFSSIVAVYFNYDDGQWTRFLIYNNKGWNIKQPVHYIADDDRTLTFTANDNFIGGLSSISVTADSGINHILYNNVTYDTFPATIPLDPAVNTMQVESKSPVLTINDGGNLKSVTYGSATFTKFPATVTATAPEFTVTARGKDSPVITVRTERTQTPVITNT